MGKVGRPRNYATRLWDPSITLSDSIAGHDGNSKDTVPMLATLDPGLSIDLAKGKTYAFWASEIAICILRMRGREVQELWARRMGLHHTPITQVILNLQGSPKPGHSHTRTRMGTSPRSKSNRVDFIFYVRQ
jgi:hypothetical protein